MLFAGRKALLKDLSMHLLPRAESRKELPIYVLHGIGGSGKSEVATKFATLHQDRYSIPQRLFARQLSANPRPAFGVSFG